MVSLFLRHLTRLGARLPQIGAALVLAALSLPAAAQDAGDETLIEIKAIAGLQFDVPRFQVKPGAKVRLTLENVDDMAHNLLIVAPGARVEVVTTAMTMPLTPTQDFVPKTPKVLWTIPVLTPGRKGEVSFTAPDKEGVYPYVCSYPGHGFIMFGAMYVGTKPLPPLAKDPNVPDVAKQAAGSVALHAFEPKPPYLYRTFMRDSGPASFAVALPQQQNFCWDAGACRLRHAWSGGFVDPLPHWLGNGDAFAEVKGRIYWRAGREFPLRFGAAENAPAKVQFRGYRLVERHPEFRYEVDGVEVRELIKAQHHGGIEATFTIANAKAAVFYLAGPEVGAKFASSVGTFSHGTLQLTPEEARSFTIRISEISAVEPLAYWSMNDILKDKKPLPVPGVNGRAIQFDGKKSKFATGVKCDALKGGGTIAFWVKLTKPAAANQVFISAGDATTQLVIGSRLNTEAGHGVTLVQADVTRNVTASAGMDDRWHHVAVNFSTDAVELFIDGNTFGKLPEGANASALPAGAEFVLGTNGQAFGAFTIDELRIYDRVLPPAEITALVRADQPSTASAK